MSCVRRRSASACESRAPLRPVLEHARRSSLDRARAEHATALGVRAVARAGDGLPVAHDFEIDWASFAFVAVDEAYAGDYDGAVVVDVGGAQGSRLLVR